VRVATALGLADLAMTGSNAHVARATSPPGLTGCSGQHLIRPQAIDFCGDGAFFLRNVRWASWESSWAVAAAVAHQDDCQPDCARGTYHVYAVAVWLTRVRKCSDARVQFTRLAYRFLVRHPVGITLGPHVVRAPLLGTTRCP
jgi:hypothetical protein